MKLYQKLCRPILHIPDMWIDHDKPLSGWHPEEEEENLRLLYSDDELKKINPKANLQFKYKYIEYGDFIKKERMVVK